MVYLISLVVYVIVFGACMRIIQTKSDQAKNLIIKLCLVGFTLQLMINYLFWGNAAAFWILANFINIERDMTDLLLLTLTSVFCYTSLAVVLFKAKELIGGH